MLLCYRYMTDIMHYAYGELGELEEEIRRSFHGHFKKNINLKSEIGVMLPSSFLMGESGVTFTFGRFMDHLNTVSGKIETPR